MQYKRVISFGDSFTWGTDLSDCTQEYPNGYSKFTWPALIAKHHDIEYKSYALGGTSNQGILRWLLSTPLEITDLLIINWTWIDRNEYFDRQVVTTDKEQGWSYIRPTEKNTVANFYFKHLHSELNDKLRSLQTIVTAIHYLNMIGVKYIMTSMDKLLVDKRYHSSVAINNLISIVDPELIWFDNNGFYNWAIDQSYAVGDTGHPLEEAHQAAFEYIRENYDFTK
jgi:hypothetical protein